jgi:hypothetical protein
LPGAGIDVAQQMLHLLDVIDALIASAIAFNFSSISLSLRARRMQTCTFARDMACYPSITRSH